MKFVFHQEMAANLKVLMNRLGYHEHLDRRMRQVSYLRRLGTLEYPHFHLYVNPRPDGLEFNLHLDEKKPSYDGQTAHSGEYGGPLVEKEMERLKQQLV